jgi:mono/diheme cytochrome c family protein
VVAALMTSLEMTSAQEYPPDIARGKAVYQRHCQSCHGLSGWGDGLAGQYLKVEARRFSPTDIVLEVG